MRNFSLLKFLALLLMAVCSATLSMAQNVAKIGTTYFTTLEDAVNSVKQGDKGYIFIEANATFDKLNIDGKQIIINLQTHTVTGNSIDVNGVEGVDTYLKILDSKAKRLSVDAKNNYKVSYTTSGTLELTGSIRAYNGAGIKVESGTVVSKQDALFAVGDITGQKDIASYVEISGGYVKAQEYGVSPQGRGASVTVNGSAVIESLDNAAVAGNGTYKDTEKRGGTSITISGKCWLIGRIQSPGYAACGIYHPQQGTLTIKYKKGTPHIVAINGAGIVMRGGTLDYQAGYITATGNANFTGKVGDSRVVVGTSGIVYDRECNYYDVANTNIAIKNDWGYTKVIGAKSAIQVVNDKNQNIDGVFDIQGGYFSSDVSAYVNDANLECLVGQDGNYKVGNYVVQVDGVKYTSAANAIGKADGKTVVLLKDCKGYTGNLQGIGSKATLDLNGKTFTLFGFSVDGELTIKDSSTKNGIGTGTIITNGCNSHKETVTDEAGNKKEVTVIDSSCGVIVKPGGKFNLEGGTIKNECAGDGWDMHKNVVFQVQGGRDDKAGGILNISGGVVDTKGTPVSVIMKGATVNVSGGELKGSGLACIAGNGSAGMGGTAINVSGGTLTATAADDASAACGIYHPNEGTLNITGGTINVNNGVGVLMRGGEMTMTGGEINATGDATRTGSVGDTNQKIGVSGVIFDRDANYPAVATTSIKIDGEAKVNGAKEAVELINTNNVADAKSAFKLQGGTYSSDVTALLDENSKAEKQGENYVVTTYYAQVGENKYTTLQEAADAATAGQTVTVLNDVDMTTGSNLTVKAGKDIVLDLNGHSIKGANTNDCTQNINVYGKLTLMDSKENSTGKIYVETPYQRDVYDRPLVYVAGNGEFVMNSGYIYTVIPDDPVNKGQYGIAAYDQGKITINGGTIEAGFCAITSRDDANSNTNITIDGGTLISPMDYAIAHRTAGKLTVIKGVIYGGSGAISMKRGELEIKGGTLTSKGTGDTGNWGDGTGNLGNAALNFCKPYGNVTATITGGTITAEGDAVLIDAQPTEGKNVDISISGGTYSSDVSKYCAAGFTATPNANGTYGISNVGDGVLVTYDKSYKQVNAGGSMDIDMGQVN